MKYLILTLILISSTLVHAKKVIKDQCAVVEIFALKKVGNKIFLQTGVGAIVDWSYLIKDKRIITPAHVIDGADVFYAYCPGSKEFSKIELLKKDIAYDLASLTIGNIKRTLNIFTKWNAKNKQEGSNVNGILTFEEQHFNFTKFQINKIENYYKNYGPYKNVLKTDIYAIRPGMSGVFTFNAKVYEKPPFQGYYHSFYPTGMLIQTKNNSTSSLAIPIETIVDFMKGKLKNYPHIKTSYKLVGDKYIKEKYYQTQHLKIEQLCSRAIQQESSEWQYVTNITSVNEDININQLNLKELIKLITVKSDFKSGGDWGDGGNPNNISSGLIKKGNLANYSGLYDEGSFYLQNLPCQKQGLLIDDTHELNTLIEPGSEEATSVKSLNDIGHLIYSPKNEKVIKDLIYFSLEKERDYEHPYFELCQDNPQQAEFYNFDFKRRNFDIYRNLGQKNISIEDKFQNRKNKNLWRHRSGTITLMNFSDYHKSKNVEMQEDDHTHLNNIAAMGKIKNIKSLDPKYFSSKFEMPPLGLKCEEKAINIRDKAITPFVHLNYDVNLSINHERIWGEINFGKCHLKVNQHRKKKWNHHILSHKFNLTVDITKNQSETEVNLNFSKFSKLCGVFVSGSEKKKMWSYSLNYKLEN